MKESYYFIYRKSNIITVYKTNGINATWNTTNRDKPLIEVLDTVRSRPLSNSLSDDCNSIEKYIKRYNVEYTKIETSDDVPELFI